MLPLTEREIKILDLIKQQEAKLSELLATFDNLLSNNARTGHGGTPNITDNAKGRAQIKAWARHEERLQSLNRQIEAQKEKIERTKKRLLPVESTKKSAKFTKKNPISNGLLALAEAGKVTQWAKNPHIFFVVGLGKVALTTFDGKAGVNSRYPAKTPAEWAICKELIKEANNE